MGYTALNVKMLEKINIQNKIKVFKKYNNYFEQKDIIVVASTHRGEESNIVNAFKSLIKELPDLFLVLAPRHPDRRNEITSLLKKQGFSSEQYLLRSEDKSLNDNIKIYSEVTSIEVGECNILLVPWINSDNKEKSVAMINKSQALSLIHI